MAFFAGSVGNIYRQFSLVMVGAIGFSAFLALSLTPALCATLLKPVEAGHHMRSAASSAGSTAASRHGATATEALVARTILRDRPLHADLSALIVGVGLLFVAPARRFLPNEDQGYIIANVQLPPGADVNRTLDVGEAGRGLSAAAAGRRRWSACYGFSFSARARTRRWPSSR